jgi:hypothetical protein
VLDRILYIILLLHPMLLLTKIKFVIHQTHTLKKGIIIHDTGVKFQYIHTENITHLLQEVST